MEINRIVAHNPAGIARHDSSGRVGRKHQRAQKTLPIDLDVIDNRNRLTSGGGHRLDQRTAARRA